MKIALIVPGGVDRSGTHRVIPALLALIKRLAVRHELHVYTLQQEYDAGSWELHGAHIHNLGARCTRMRAVGTIAAAHRRAPFRLVQSIFSGTPGLLAAAAGRVLGIPSLIHVAGGELVAIQDIRYGGRLTWKGRLREWMVLRAASVVSAASEPMIAELEQLHIRARRVPLGVDCAVWPPRPPAPRKRGSAARLLHVGSLNNVKDQSTLLRAFAVVAKSRPEVHLDIVGEDTLNGETRSVAIDLGVADRVTFHGFLTQSELRPVMEAADLLVMSSRHEAGPLVALEAAIAGVPTVGTAVGHIAEWAPEAALAAPVGDAASIAGLIEQLLTDEACRLRLAAEAQRRALREDADHTVRCFEQLYAALGCS
jgi:glycosyltransferase involved in cell wall biosynthesis